MPMIEQQRRKTLHRNTARRTVLFYALFASLWIYFSDMLLALFISNPELLTQAQTLKGWLYVLVTASLLYLYLSHCLRTLNQHEEALAKERNNAQQDILERFNQLSLLFDSMSAVVYVADLESYQLLYVNSFATDFFGPNWQGQKCYHYLQSNMDQPCDFCTNSQLLMNGEPGAPIKWEILNTRNNRWYECFDKAIRWTDGRMVRLEIALDITERKELEKLRNNLLSSMSHEMRTPLTAISGFAELLKNEVEIPEQHRRHIEIIYREADKLTELVNRFLDIRRLKIDRARTNYEYLTVQSLLEKAQKKAHDCKKKHTIVVDCQPGLQLYGNSQELSQVVSQLLENACRYSPKGGIITLSARPVEQGICLQVKDQGIGIPHHELESIFNPFHRLDTGDSRSTGGVGLGLCVAKEIVVLHGGQIQADSSPGEGSTFTILLPQPIKREDSDTPDVS